MEWIDSIYGVLANNCPIMGSIGSLIFLLILGYFGSPLPIWTVALLAVMIGFGAPVWILIGFVVISLFFNIKPVRAALISRGVMSLFKKLQIVPKISETERIALEAGVTWVERDLFSGKPDFKSIMSESYPQLTAEEKAFIDGPVEELCRLIEPWKVYKNRELPSEVWDFIKREKFFGMIIPKSYGGLEFSALAHSEVVMKLGSRSVAGCVTVMVPNSLGPAELLIHYGTQQQKDYYLPRLARGEEIPCFGLTEPMAGSDAGSITSTGILFKGSDGKLYIKLNWNKRYITLAAVSTLLGLAFKLRDPENILGQGEDVGITCALIPSNTPGVILGRRHDPLSVPFYNCPTQGKDVVVSVDAVVGGVGGCGKGWSMLMDCLAAGRGISLPAQATGGAKLSSLVVSSHATVRKQFGVSIGKFEGVEEPMARVGGFTYGLEAMRKYTVGALDKGVKPPVITAMAKYYSTELARKVINDAMDIVGGNGISMGPRNLLGEIYMGTPIGITVEGANIMTRTLIVFGQGALRAHPFAFSEVKALEAGNLKDFDMAFWGHIGHVVRNACRSILLSVTRGYIASAPANTHCKLKVYFRRLAWASATFAIMADIAMGTLGGALKLKEKITGRFADILAHMYIACAVLKRFEAEGQKKEDLPFVIFNLKHCMVEIQKGFDGLFDNMRIPGLTWFFKGWLGAWSRINSMGSLSSDAWTHVMAESMMDDHDLRLRLTEGIYVPKAKDQQLGRLEYAYTLVQKSVAVDKKIRKAVKDGVLARKKGPALVMDAKEKNVITEEEFKLLQETEVVRLDAIMVDDFNETEYRATNLT